jgi:hypothetical protein
MFVFPATLALVALVAIAIRKAFGVGLAAAVPVEPSTLVADG